MNRIRWHIIHILFFWLIVVVYLIVTMGLVSDHHRDALCNHIKIEVTDSSHRQFVKRNDVLRLVQGANVPLQGTPLRTIEKAAIEDAVRQNPFVSRSEVFSTIDGSVRVEVSQRKPLFRVINRRGKNYYVDDEGFIIGFRGIYPSHVLVASGNIPDPVSDSLGVCHVMKQNNIWTGLYKLAEYVTGDNLWKNQIEQVYVRTNGEVELIPRVGAHLIILGEPEGFEKKLHKLEILYEKGFGKSNWNNYEQINLKYENQIVCTKR